MRSLSALGGVTVRAPARVRAPFPRAHTALTPRAYARCGTRPEPLDHWRGGEVASSSVDPVSASSSVDLEGWSSESAQRGQM